MFSFKACVFFAIANKVFAGYWNTSEPRAEDVIQFENVGYSSFYRQVASLGSSNQTECGCELSEEKTYFDGVNSPLNEELSVHFRGPMELEFGYYVADDFNLTSGSSGSDWHRLVYYNSYSGYADNVTFTNNKGADSTPCLGPALSYAAPNGVNSSSSPEVLAQTVVPSNEYFSIFSQLKCGPSGLYGDCGVYRPHIPAYHGFYANTKMFLFKFNAPNDFQADPNSSFPNIPAIWLLNAQIPRTAQFPTNGSCSCWGSGCGEFDVFEVLNTTDLYKFTTTLHTYQDAEWMAEGTLADAWTTRTPNAEMKSGVIFDSAGTISVFMSNDTEIQPKISAYEAYSLTASYKKYKLSVD